jgi:hypothetical protein
MTTGRASARRGGPSVLDGAHDLEHNAAASRLYTIVAGA